MHECPRCGKLTSGSYSEGGAKWAICEDCMIREQKENEIREKEDKKNIQMLTEE